MTQVLMFLCMCQTTNSPHSTTIWIIDDEGDAVPPLVLILPQNSWSVWIRCVRCYGLNASLIISAISDFSGHVTPHGTHVLL